MWRLHCLTCKLKRWSPALQASHGKRTAFVVHALTTSKAGADTPVGLGAKRTRILESDVAEACQSQVRPAWTPRQVPNFGSCLAVGDARALPDVTCHSPTCVVHRVWQSSLAVQHATAGPSGAADEQASRPPRTSTNGCASKLNH